MKSKSCLGVIAFGLFASDAFALEATVPVTRITSTEQLPIPVLELYSKNCPMPIEMVPDWSKGSESGGFEIKLEDGRQLFILTCDWGGSNIRQNVFLFNGISTRDLEFSHQDEKGQVTYLPGLYNAQYLEDGVLMSVTSEVCSLDYSLADYAKLEGEALLPFIPDKGRRVCAE
jgi:hypothetical protein